MATQWRANRSLLVGVSLLSVKARLSILGRVVLAVLMACWVPACLCGGVRSLGDQPAASSHHCCHHHGTGEPTDHSKQKRRCDCDQSPAVTGKVHSTFDVAVDVPAVLPPAQTVWSRPALSELVVAPLHPLKQAVERPCATLLRQHCALIV
jgi:hypothetical protein